MSTASGPSRSGRTARATRLRWRVWPVFAAPWPAAAIVASAAVVGAVVHGVTDRVHLALLAGAAVLLGFWRAFAPVAYQIDEQGVSETSWGAHHAWAWEGFERFEAAPDRARLWPRAEAGSPAGAPVVVPFGGHREEVLAALRRRLSDGSA
ncbi:MAG: hypothetical protein ACOY3P_13745 [Planctomycetota bacterium]